MNFYFSSWNRFHLVLIILPVFFSCAKKHVSREELQAYVADSTHGLRKCRRQDDAMVEVLYRPSDLLQATNLKDTAAKPGKAMYDSCYYFVVNLSKSDQELEVFYVNAGYDLAPTMERLAFGMQQYMYITTPAKDTIFPLDVVYPRMYGSSGRSSFMLAFKKNSFSSLDHFDFLIQDVGLEIGKSRFTYDMADIEKTPGIKF
jgi:hypothetical protein